MDGVDAALIRTDGEGAVQPVAAHYAPYDDAFRHRLHSVLGGRGPVEAVARELTERHIQAGRDILAAQGLDGQALRVIGLHGHTIHHDPQAGQTWQIGDGVALAQALGCPVVCRFRDADVAKGGQGAPLVPVYHRALMTAAGEAAPVAVLNLGGVANVTWIGADGALLAFDTGPGNAMLDDLMRRTNGGAMDVGGELAARGRVREDVLAVMMQHPYLAAPPPKSLDRQTFALQSAVGIMVRDLAPADAAATLVAFTSACVARATAHLPAAPKRWLVAGGGRRNPVLMASLRHRLTAPVDPVEQLGWDGDALEAQAFAYLAVRSLHGLPLTYPGTTGVPEPTRGGVLVRPDEGERLRRRNG